LGFFRWLCELRPPIGSPTRRQLLDGLCAGILQPR